MRIVCMYEGAFSRQCLIHLSQVEGLLSLVLRNAAPPRPAVQTPSGPARVSVLFELTLTENGTAKRATRNRSCTTRSCKYNVEFVRV